MGFQAVDLALRFNAKVLWQDDGPDSCAIWCGTLNDAGYGRVRVKGRLRAAHRVAWELEHGRIPYGRIVRHKCGNPACVRIDHLVLGELYRKLTVAQVIEIRAAQGSLREVGMRYRISKSHCKDIKAGKKRTSDLVV